MVQVFKPSRSELRKLLRVFNKGLRELGLANLVAQAPCPDSWILAAFAADTLDEKSQKELNAHIAFCDRCFEEYVALAGPEKVPKILLSDERMSREESLKGRRGRLVDDKKGQGNWIDNFIRLSDEIVSLISVAHSGDLGQATASLKGVLAQVQLMDELSAEQRLTYMKLVSEIGDVIRRRRDQSREGPQAWNDHLRQIAQSYEGVIAKLRQQVDNLESNVTNARTPEWADRQRSWAAEKKKAILTLEEKIRSLRKNLR